MGSLREFPIPHRPPLARRANAPSRPHRHAPGPNRLSQRRLPARPRTHPRGAWDRCANSRFPIARPSPAGRMHRAARTATLPPHPDTHGAASPPARPRTNPRGAWDRCANSRFPIARPSPAWRMHRAAPTATLPPHPDTHNAASPPARAPILGVHGIVARIPDSPSPAPRPQGECTEPPAPPHSRPTQTLTAPPPHPPARQSSGCMGSLRQFPHSPSPATPLPHPNCT